MSIIKESEASMAMVEFERSYEAPVEDLWHLWTTKDGFESWWGPEGFRVEVHSLDLRVGGELSYDMIADGAEQIAAMKAMGMPLSHPTRGTFVEVVPVRRLRIRSRIDFIPDLAPYDNHMTVDLIPDGARVRMVIVLERHPTDEWTQRAGAGLSSQLTKVPAALARQAAARP